MLWTFRMSLKSCDDPNMPLLLKTDEIEIQNDFIRININHID